MCVLCTKETTRRGKSKCAVGAAESVDLGEGGFRLPRGEALNQIIELETLATLFLDKGFESAKARVKVLASELDLSSVDLHKVVGDGRLLSTMLGMLLDQLSRR